jgi:large subunit ribosomal protein L22
MPGPKTNEREGTRAVLRYVRVSPYKLRQVIDAIRGKPVEEAADLLRFVERDAAIIVDKLLHSAVANAATNDHLDPEELFVSACYVDEGPTAKRWRPRARGRATRIRKRSSHITIIVSRLPEERLSRLQARRRAENLAMRARRVEATRRARPGAAEAQNRRERRHPETIAADEETPVSEAGPETEETTSAEQALVSEVADEEATDADEAHEGEAESEAAIAPEAGATTPTTSAGEAVTEEAKVAEQPEPEVEASHAEEPATDELATDEPATDEPGTDEPGTDEPATDEPGTIEKDT